MNNRLLLLLASTTSEETSESTGGTTDKLMNALKDMVKSPIFYIVIAAIVLLIIAVYLIRRIVKPTPNVIKVVVRHGKIHKLIKEGDQKYFLVPFTDSVSAVISLDEREVSSDQLFINNGPDALYKVNFTLKYKVTDVEGFYPYRENINKVMITKINEELREYADNGHALDIVKDYRENSQKILSLINHSVNGLSIEVTSFKVNFIEPFGKK